MSTTLLLVSAPKSFAHDFNFVVSRDEASLSRLYVNGPSNYLDESDNLDLLPGDGVLSGYWFNDAPGFSTLKQDGAIRKRLRLHAGHRLALRLVHHDPGFCLVEASTWNPVLVADGDTYEFVLDENGDFTQQMITRVDRPGTLHATFQFVDRAGLHADSAPFTLGFRASKAMTVQYLMARTLKTKLSPSSRLALSVACFLAAISEGRNASPSATLSADGHFHLPGKPFIPPKNYREAITELRRRLHDIDGWIVSSKFCNIAPQADVLRRLATLIPLLAAEANSGVPSADHDELTRAAATVSAICDALTMAANWSDPIGIREHYQQLYSFLERCETFIPRTYICPMGCEGEKTYPKPGKCPDCGMNLSDTRAHMDHQPKHGGTFFMAPDYLHHLEGTLTDQGEFRVYFYDEYTKSIKASAFTANIEAWGPDEKVRSLPLHSGDAAEFLSTGPLKSITYPWRVKLLVDFHDGQEPQRFDFDFAEPRR